MNVSRGLIVAQGILSGFAVGAVVAVVGLGGAVLLMEPTQMEPLPANVTIKGRESETAGAVPDVEGAADDQGQPSQPETSVPNPSPAAPVSSPNVASETDETTTDEGAKNATEVAEAPVSQGEMAQEDKAADSTEDTTEASTEDSTGEPAPDGAPSPQTDMAADTAPSPQIAAPNQAAEDADPEGATAATPPEATPKAAAIEPSSDLTEPQVPESETLAESPAQPAPDPDAAPTSPTLSEAKSSGSGAERLIVDEDVAMLDPPKDTPTSPQAPKNDVIAALPEAPIAAPDAPETTASAPSADPTPTPVTEPEMQGPQLPDATSPANEPSAADPATAPPSAALDAGEGENAQDTAPPASDAEAEDDLLAAAPPKANAPAGLPETSVVTNRLPRIGDAPEEAASSAAPNASNKAIDRNKIGFSGPGDLPKMAILLLDSGAARTEVGDLSLLPFPLSVAVDASAPDAEEAIAYYRENGAEVVLIVPLPEGATATDVDVTFQAYAPLLDQAVAVMAEESVGFQSLGAGALQVVTNLTETGHGLVSYTQGLNTGHKAALKEGVPAGQVFRDLDGEGQAPAVIRRFLDNVAFKARNEDGVIALARVTPDSIQALLEWSLGNRAQTVALAPISATLPR